VVVSSDVLLSFQATPKSDDFGAVWIMCTCMWTEIINCVNFAFV